MVKERSITLGLLRAAESDKDATTRWSGIRTTGREAQPVGGGRERSSKVPRRLPMS